MSAMSLDSAVHRRPAETFAAFGLLAGLLSAVWGQTYEFEVLQPLAMLFLLTPGALPIGFFFGAAMGIAIAAWTRKPWVAIALVATTMYAWSAAIHTAVRLQRNTGDDVYLLAASLCAGAVGAGLAHLGCALFAAPLRHPWRIILTCAVGSAAGLLFFAGERKMIDERLLYLVWQPAVAFCIGRGLAQQGTQA
jgi:hypothetical protein